MTSHLHSPIRGVILDVDGTLIDSNHAHAQSWCDILGRHGFEVPYDQVRRKIGMGGDKLLKLLTGIDKESEEGSEMSKERLEHYLKDFAPKIQAFPRTRELLARFKSQGLALAIATSSKKDELKKSLRSVGLDGIVDEKATADDAKRSKPDPDILRAALDELGLAPQEVIMLGDTPYDVEAALKLGIRTVAFRCGGWRDQDLKDAVAIYDNPADLLDHWDQSPFSADRLRQSA